MESKKRNSLKPTNHTKKIIFLAFLLSLLFHVGSLVYVTIEKAQQDPALPLSNPTEILQQKNKQQDNEWVETKARAGNFGTPVYFQDEFEPQSVETQQDEQINDKPEVIETKQEDTSEKKETTEEPAIEKEKYPETKLQPHFAEATKDKPTSMVTKDSQPKPTAHKKHIPLVTQKPQSTQNRPLAAPKPPLTLAQLSQGFLNHVKDEGKHAIHMLGKKNY